MLKSYSVADFTELLQVVSELKKELGKQVRAHVAAYGILLLETSPGNFIPEEEFQTMLQCGRTTVKEIFAIYRAYRDRVQASEQCLSDQSISLDQQIDQQTDLPYPVLRTLKDITVQYFNSDSYVLNAAISFLSRIYDPALPINPELIIQAAEITSQDCNDAARQEPIKYPYKWWLAIIRNLYQDQLQQARELPVPVCAPEEENIPETQEFAQAILDSAVGRLGREEGREDLYIWFSKIKAVAYKAKTLYLSAENEMSRDWVQTRWLKPLSRHLSGFKLVWCP